MLTAAAQGTSHLGGGLPLPRGSMLYVEGSLRVPRSRSVEGRWRSRRLVEVQALETSAIQRQLKLEKYTGILGEAVEVVRRLEAQWESLPWAPPLLLQLGMTLARPVPSISTLA